MVKSLLAAGALALLAAAPALAVAPECHDQLAQLKPQIDAAKDKAGMNSKYQQAERLCGEKKDMEAQNLIREMRSELARKGGGSMEESGSTTPSETQHGSGTNR